MQVDNFVSADSKMVMA